MNYLEPEDFENTSTSVLEEYRKRIDNELTLREHGALRGKLWRTKVRIIKELSYRIKK